MKIDGTPYRSVWVDPEDGWTVRIFDQTRLPWALEILKLGAAALALTYVASGRMDAYVEFGLSLWDIAAGGFIIERAGGEFWHEPAAGEHKFRIIASNGLLRARLARLI